jgi:hypothetical protein
MEVSDDVDNLNIDPEQQNISVDNAIDSGIQDMPSPEQNIAAPVDVDISTSTAAVENTPNGIEITSRDSTRKYVLSDGQLTETIQIAVDDSEHNGTAPPEQWEDNVPQQTAAQDTQQINIHPTGKSTDQMSVADTLAYLKHFDQQAEFEDIQQVHLDPEEQPLDNIPYISADSGQEEVQKIPSHVPFEDVQHFNGPDSGQQ